MFCDFKNRYNNYDLPSFQKQYVENIEKDLKETLERAKLQQAESDSVVVPSGTTAVSQSKNPEPPTPKRRRIAAPSSIAKGVSTRKRRPTRKRKPTRKRRPTRKPKKTRRRKSKKSKQNKRKSTKKSTLKRKPKRRPKKTRRRKSKKN